MNKQRIVWLHEQLPEWEAKGWISKEHAAQMRVFYGTVDTNQGPLLRRLLVLLLGLLLTSLGVFLLFAGYWYSFSPAGRMDWCIALLLLAVIALGLGLWKAPRGSIYAEGTGLFYVAALTISTVLMSDTYYTGEGWGFYALIIMLLTLPVIYLLGSGFTMMAYLLIGLLWSVSAREVTMWGEPVWLWLLLAAGSPFFAEQLRKRTRSYLSTLWLLWAYVAAIFGAFFFTITSYNLSLGLFFVASLSAATYALGSLSREQGLWSLPFRGIGVLGLMYVVVYGTFISTWQEEAAASADWLSIGLGIVALILVAGGLNALWQKRMGTEILITFCPIVVGLLMLSVHWGVTPLTGSILFNLYVVLLAIVLLWQGTVTKRVGLVNGCIFTFLAMIAARFFDPTFSFVERGFTFMVTGVAIFAVNLFYMWRKQTQRAQVNTSVARANRRLRRRQTLGDDEHIEVTDTGEHTESAGNYTTASGGARTEADGANPATVSEGGNMAYTAREQDPVGAESADKTTARKGESSDAQ